MVAKKVSILTFNKESKDYNHDSSYIVYFGSLLERVKYGGLCESCYLFHSLWLFSRSFSFISIWPFETQSIQTLKQFIQYIFWVQPR